MDEVLLIINIVLATAIIAFVLIQGRGGGLGSAWGGGGGEQFQTRRGIEKFTMYVTVGLIVVFFCISLVQLLLQ